MKLLLVMYSGPAPQRIAALLEAHAVPGYTEFDDARGAGVTGRIDGSRAWPGSNTVFVSALPDERVPDVQEALQDYKGSAAEGEHLHVATLPVEDYF